ncbi:unnamed protein product [Brassica rapa subsp. narinosa]
MKMAAEILDEGGNIGMKNLLRIHLNKSAIYPPYPKIEKCLYNLVVSISINQPLCYYNSAIPQIYPRI